MQVKNTPDYQEQVKAEKRQFTVGRYDPGTYLEVIPEALNYFLEAFDAKVKRVLGEVPFDYIVSQVNARPGANILSLGSGPCGLEIGLAKRFTVPYRLTCMDLNEEPLRIGKEKGQAEGINIRTVAQDANFIRLTETYDVIIGHSALHHFINFEHIFPELHDHLSPSGVFIAHEPVPRNGMLIWPETKTLIDHLFAALPFRYRRTPAEGGGWTIHDTFPERNLTEDAFECIRSEELVGLLERYFHVVARIDGFSFARRFVETAFARNYDLTREEDRVIIDMVIAFDEWMTARGHLRPENVFMVMGRKR